MGYVAIAYVAIAIAIGGDDAWGPGPGDVGGPCSPPPPSGSLEISSMKRGRAGPWTHGMFCINTKVGVHR